MNILSGLSDTLILRSHVPFFILILRRKMVKYGTKIVFK